MKKILIGIMAISMFLFIAGCGKTASSGGGGGGGNNYQRTTKTIESNANSAEELLAIVTAAITSYDDVTLGEGVSLDVSDTAIYIPSNKTLTVGDGATLNFDTSAIVVLGGQLIVGEGGALVNNVSGGKQWQDNNSAAIVIQPGSSVYQSGTLFIGDDDAIISLSSGSLSLKKNPDVANSTLYELDGDAAVNTGKTFTIGGSGTHPADQVVINAGATLTASGTIHILSELQVKGAYAVAADDNWNSGSDTGTVVYYAGATGVVGSETRLGSAGDSPTAIELGSGAVFAMTKDSYEVRAGTVTSKQVAHIGGAAPVKTVSIQSGAALVLAANLNVWSGGTLNKNGTTITESGGNVVNSGGTVNE
jgi:hypothetical protein